MTFRFLKPAHLKVRDFRRGRHRQTDDEFFAQCGLPDNPASRRVALAVRRAAANVGLVDSQFIHVADDYPGTLELLPLWDSMDWLAFAIELEEELGQKIPEMLERLRGAVLHCSRAVTIGEMVVAVHSAVSEEEM